MLSQVETLRREALTILESAKAHGHGSPASKAIREATRLLELQGRITGEIDEKPQTTINLHVRPQWMAIRGAIFEALRPHPQVRDAVESVAALQDRRALPP